MKNKENIIKEIIELKEEGFSYKHLSKKYGYSEDLIKSWVTKQKKQTNTYNEDHIDEKYYINSEFFNAVNPESILDLYCGRNRFWATNYGSECKVISNDALEDKEAKPDYKMNIKADQLLQAYLMVDKHFDLIDIDPYGSPKECIEAGIKLADKGLIITFGDFKNYCKRFSTDKKNLFKELYGINLSKKEVTIEHVAEYVIKLSDNKLKVWDIVSWRYCDRIYFIKEG